jgi:hypothetical protein
MLKIAALLFNSIALLFYQLFFADTVTITPTIPAYAQIGTEFTVELTIDKGSNTGFAKFQQELPPGFTVIEGESNGGSFTFINQTVKIIWMVLPGDQSFKISYKVKVSAEAKGTHNLGGKFAYIYDNVKQSALVPPTTIVVSDEPVAQITATTSQPVIPAVAVDTVRTVQPTVEVAKAPEQAVNVSCTRQLPENILSNNDFFVEITIQKGNLSGFAKLVENLPAGFTAQEVQSGGALFSFEDQKLSYIWSSLPTQSEIKISYKVKVAPSTEGEQLIEGVFSFVENDQTMKYVLSPGFVKVISSTPAKPIVSATPKTELTAENIPSQPIAKKKAASEKPVAPKELSATNIPGSQRTGKLHYKVQVLALRKAKAVETIVGYFKIQETISLEMADGYTKYTAGYHEDYKSAHDARDNFKAYNNMMSGSFVTAYNHGKRITVQEALMITNQKWYK